MECNDKVRDGDLRQSRQLEVVGSCALGRQYMMTRRGSMPKLSMEVQNWTKTIHSKDCELELIPKVSVLGYQSQGVGVGVSVLC